MKVISELAIGISGWLREIANQRFYFIFLPIGKVLASNTPVLYFTLSYSIILLALCIRD